MNFNNRTIVHQLYLLLKHLQAATILVEGTVGWGTNLTVCVCVWGGGGKAPLGYVPGVEQGN